MIKIKRHINIFSLRKKWKRLEADGGIHVYQKFFYQSKVFLRLPLYLIPKRQIPVYFEIIDDGKTKMIIPLCRTVCTNRYESLGNFNGLPFYDFIYSKTMPEDQFVSYIEAFLDSIKDSCINIYMMHENSFTYRQLQSNGFCRDISLSEYVNIACGNDYEEYSKNLSKGARQNIRTAYNRLSKDSLNMRFELLFGKRIRQKFSNMSVNLYCNRHLNRYQVKNSKLKRFYLQYLDFSTICLKKYKRNFWAILFVDDQFAGFLAGFYDEISNSIDARRISMDDKYSRYSPGILIINETVKALITEFHIKNLDLTIGKENYKLSMGGKVYHVANYKLAH